MNNTSWLSCNFKKNLNKMNIVVSSSTLEHFFNYGDMNEFVQQKKKKIYKKSEHTCRMFKLKKIPGR